jgi:hypothetical protein
LIEAEQRAAAVVELTQATIAAQAATVVHLQQQLASRNSQAGQAGRRRLTRHPQGPTEITATQQHRTNFAAVLPVVVVVQVAKHPATAATAVTVACTVVLAGVVVAQRTARHQGPVAMALKGF